MANWYTASDGDEQARLHDAWPDAPVQNVEFCQMILDTAREQVTAYAGSDDPIDDPPARYVIAQLQQARNLWTAGRTTGEGDIGPDGYVFRPYPLDNIIKQMIRPINGAPHVL